MYYFPGEFVRDFYKADDGGRCDGWTPARLWFSPPGEAIDFLKQTKLDEYSPELAKVVRLAINECIHDDLPNVTVDPQVAHELVRFAQERDYQVTYVPDDSQPGSDIDVLHSMFSSGQ